MVGKNVSLILAVDIISNFLPIDDTSKLLNFVLNFGATKNIIDSGYSLIYLVLGSP